MGYPAEIIDGVVYCKICVEEAVEGSDGKYYCSVISPDNKLELTSDQRRQLRMEDAIVKSVNSKPVNPDVDLDRLYSSLSVEEIQKAADGINCGFLWSYTEEGTRFWSDVVAKLRRYAEAAEAYQNREFHRGNKVQYTGRDLNSEPGAGLVQVRGGQRFTVVDITLDNKFVLGETNGIHVWLPTEDLERVI